MFCPPMNKRSRGHIADMRNSTSLSKVLIIQAGWFKTGKYLQLKRKAAFQLKELEFRLPKDALFKSGWNFIISPLKMMWPFIWRNLNPFYAWCFVSTLVEIGNVDLEKFLTSSIFTIISPWNRTWDFILIYFNPCHPRILCGYSFVTIGPLILEKFLNVANVILLLFPLGKGCDPLFEQTWIPMKNTLCQVWLKLA